MARKGNVTMRLITVAIVLCRTATTDATYQKSDVNNLRKLLTDHFSTNRHHVTNPDGKKAASDFLYETFKSFGLHTWQWSFAAEHGYTGTNIFGMWPGRNTGTALDRPICLEADLDTEKDSPGRDDNGSGMAAVVEAARLITSQSCMQDNTIFFAVLDFGEQSDGPDGACAAGSCGSADYVSDAIAPYLHYTGVAPAQMGGIITLDAVLNYNNSVMSQRIPFREDFRKAPGMAECYDAVKADDNRGNFILVVYRTNRDATLHAKMVNKWAGEKNPEYKILSAGIPFDNVTAIVDAREAPYWRVYDYLVTHDIGVFWKQEESMPAILVTDTEVDRQREKNWGQCGPDDNIELTTDRLQFLKKTTDVITAVIRDMAGTRQECRDPVAEAPSDFKPDLQLSGDLTLRPGDTKPFTLHVTSFTSSGLVKATLSNDSWTMDFEGRYDGDTHLLLLRPTPLAQNDLDARPLICGMTGNLEELADGVLYSGQLEGGCGLTREETAHVTFVLYSGGLCETIGSPTLVILGAVGGVAVALLAAAAVRCIYKRRYGTRPSWRPLPQPA